MAAKPPRQVSCKATPAKANKEKSNARSAAECGVPRKVTAPGKPASQFWQRERQGRARGCPQRPRCRKRKSHGDAPRAPARLRWAGADKAQKDDRATLPCGGSRGPADPWSAAAASKRRGEALERLCREIAQRCADGRSASEPVPLFPAAVQAANAKGLGLCLISIRSRKNNDNTICCNKS